MSGVLFDSNTPPEPTIIFGEPAEKLPPFATNVPPEIVKSERVLIVPEFVNVAPVPRVTLAGKIIVPVLVIELGNRDILLRFAVPLFTKPAFPVPDMASIVTEEPF